MIKTKKYPKQIYLIWIASFLFGLDVMSSFIIAFYKDWGGINQFQIQILQSWFMFSIFIFEVPTGLVGDVRGRKFSVTIGALFAAIGFYIYGLSPNFYLFLASEAVVAIGVAFWSGAREALLYDICKGKRLFYHLFQW
jgi:DHA3 family tetracycline resistance protein-like MFS transporter